MFKSCHVLTLALYVFLLFGPLAYGADKPAASATNEREVIYMKFLDRWLGPPGGKPTNLSELADKADIKEFEQEGSCLNGATLEEPQENRVAFNFAGTAIAHRPDIRLIDPKHWKPSDPGGAIGKTKSVEQAVQNGFDHGLLTLSEIVFDKQHKIAVFSYAFYCGSLCGSGSVVVFLKSNGEWVQSKKQCGGWIS